MLPPSIEFKSVEGNSLAADTDLADIGTDLGIEAVSVHAEISRGIPKSKYANRRAILCVDC